MGNEARRNDGTFMGTRHLIEVKIDGELKVAQYGQWDGYLTGQGVNIADFIHNKMDVDVVSVETTPNQSKFSMSSN
jgi:hypothetical protein